MRVIDAVQQHASRKPRASIFIDDVGRWRWHTIAANGQTTATSGESFSTKSNARRALRAFLASTAPDSGSDYGTTVE